MASDSHRWTSRMRRACPTPQHGVSLIESLVAILLFSFGLLGIIAVQAKSIAVVGDANVRAQAALYGEQLVGRMWADSANLSSYALNASAQTCTAGSNASTNVAVTDWLSELALALPGADRYLQTIRIDANGVVSLMLCWQGPKDLQARQFSIATQIP